jgi:ABC-type tungstate transport system substrate-binding protein
MQRSIFLAKLIGPFLAVCGIALMFNADVFRIIGGEIVKSPALIYIAGILALVTGLAIVNTHNEWTADWRVVITLLGWLCVVAGIIRLVLVSSVGAFGASVLAIVSNGWIVGEGVVILALGAWLSFKGYAPGKVRAKRKR